MRSVEPAVFVESKLIDVAILKNAISKSATSAEQLITWARAGSLMWMTFGLACCAIEMMRCQCRATMPSASALRLALRPGNPA